MARKEKLVGRDGELRVRKGDRFDTTELQLQEVSLGRAAPEWCTIYRISLFMVKAVKSKAVT